MSTNTIAITPRIAATLLAPRWGKLPIPVLRREQAQAIESTPRFTGTGPRQHQHRVWPVCQTCGKRVPHVRQSVVLGAVCPRCYSPERERDTLRQVAAQRREQAKVGPALAAMVEAKEIRARIAEEQKAKNALMAKLKAMQASFK